MVPVYYPHPSAGNLVCPGVVEENRNRARPLPERGGVRSIKGGPSTRTELTSVSRSAFQIRPVSSQLRRLTSRFRYIADSQESACRIGMEATAHPPPECACVVHFWYSGWFLSGG